MATSFGPELWEDEGSLFTSTTLEGSDVDVDDGIIDELVAVVVVVVADLLVLLVLVLVVVLLIMTTVCLICGPCRDDDDDDDDEDGSMEVPDLIVVVVGPWRLVSSHVPLLSIVWSSLTVEEVEDDDVGYRK